MSTTLIEHPSSSGGRVNKKKTSLVTMSMATYRFVLLAVAVISFYFFFIADDRYATTSQVFIKSTSPPVPTLPVGFGLQPQSEGLQDAYQLRDYIYSSDMLALLEKRLNVRQHYSGDWDYFSRLSSSASDEDFLDYYRNHVTLQILLDSTSLIIETQGFTKDFSEKLNRSILELCDEFINSISQKAAAEEVTFVEDLLQTKLANLDNAQQKLLAFQNERGAIDLQSVIAGAQGTIIEINSRLSQSRAELKAKRSFLSDESSQVKEIINTIKALEAQRLEEQSRLASIDGGSINEKGAEEARLRLELQFAQEIYSAALQSLEQKQIVASQKAKFLTVIQSPRLADEAKYPDRLYIVISTLILLSIAYGIIIMVTAAVQEHRDV